MLVWFGRPQYPLEMQTVFSHIVQKRLSQESENVATTALAFMLDTSEATRAGMMKLLRGVVPQLPRLWFRTQQTEGDNRPDMWGNDDAGLPHVFVENKFWAGLTDNQPVSYLRILAKHPYATVLLMVAPKARELMLARELKLRMEEAGISATEQGATAGTVMSFTTNIGPILALTSWDNLFSFLELELADDPAARNDLLQLRALCDAVDNEAFAPISAEQLSDLRAPGFVLQLGSLVQEAVAFSVKAGILDCRRLNPQADFNRTGRYAYLGQDRQVGIWLGIHFRLWKAHGGTPLWVVISGDFGRASEVLPLLEPWAEKTRVVSVRDEDDFALAVDIKVGEDKETVIKAIAVRLKQIADVVSVIQPKTVTAPPEGGK